MSFVFILAAEVPLPICNQRSLRTMGDGRVSVTADFGFSVETCTYYPHEMAHCRTLPFRYKMESLIWDRATLWDLTHYLRTHLAPGSAAELWHIWLDGAPLRKAPPRYHGTLADLDMDAFSQLFESGECCLSVQI